MAPGSLFGALWNHFLAWARKLLQEACVELSGAIFWPGLGNGSRKLVWSSLGPCSGLGSEMAPGSLFGALWAHFLAWAWKWLQEACLELSGPIFWPGLGNAVRKPVWSSLGAFSGLGWEIAPGNVYGSLRQFHAWARKLLQEDCLELSRLSRSLKGPKGLLRREAPSVVGAKRRPPGPWALGPTELSTGQLKRVDRSSVCEEIRVFL